MVVTTPTPFLLNPMHVGIMCYPTYDSAGVKHCAMHDVDCAAPRCGPKNLLGLRDRALILTGFAATFRRSGLCAMTVADLCF